MLRVKFLYIEITINPEKVKIPPMITFIDIISQKIKYAKIVAMIGSPTGKAATMVGETYFTA